MSEFNYKPFWDSTLKQLKKEMDEFSFIYLSSLKYKDSKENCLILVAPSKFYKDQIMQKYSAKIEKHLLSVSKIRISLQIDVDTNMEQDDNIEAESEITKSEKKKRSEK